MDNEAVNRVADHLIRRKLGYLPMPEAEPVKYDFSVLGKIAMEEINRLIALKEKEKRKMQARKKRRVRYCL
ncbi:hypothetical protein [Thalassomonas actiniarum]|uniref:Uncharacterized protein n=1 Tax=Thalassomonas actiniarum TaxID=485447 RepID=A0AAF0C4F1_9GAMM|nr:hypothetical protein [Thalassomonas actiniarum]WDE02247.1 hypothetical protein SG35_031315 [Thalassomonas actiniarum]